MPAPLEGITVLDFTQGHGGPFCTMHLADAGAEVVKIEPPGGDWARQLGPPTAGDESAYFLALNRNKKSVGLDLRDPRGLEIARDLARTADVVVQNYRPGIADELGIGYAALSAINPGLIYCSISAYDSEGPDRDLPGTELTLQARGGVMRTLGEVGQPPVRFGEDGISAATGNYATQAVVAALFHRLRTGEGQHVKVSMLRSVMHLQSCTFTFDCAPDRGQDDPRTRPTEPNAGYATADLPIGFNFPFMLAGYPADERWREFCHRIGLAHIADDPRFADRFGREGNANVLREYYETAFANYTSAELSEILEEFGALNAVYNDFPTLLAHPQILANELVIEFDHPTAGSTKTVGFPTVMTETPKQLRTPPPLLGQHTAEVLGTVGVTAEELTTLRGRGVV